MTDPLSALVRDGKLSSPVRRDFDRRAWDDALAAQPESASTRSFFDTMMWFARELGVAHASIAKLHLNRFDRDALVYAGWPSCSMRWQITITISSAPAPSPSMLGGSQ